ncbi:MAG: methyltransferase domain-containing protein [archaeon]
MKKVGPVSEVFDIGCGDGFMSKYFLELGSRVTGIDSINKPLIKNKNFKFLDKDIRDYKFIKKFDLNICSLFLHFFTKEGANYLLKKIKENTKSGGYNLLICMTNKDNFSKYKPTNFYPSSSDLIKLYSDWNLISIVSGETEKENHGNLGEHYHNLVFALFQKNIN